MTLVPYKSCLLSLTEGAQPALRVQTAVSSEARRCGVGTRRRRHLGRQCLLLTCSQVHGFDLNFFFILIILLNLYSGNLNAFQK